MRALIIAPVPPPISGNSLPVKILKEDFEREMVVEIINVNKAKHKSGFALGRMFQICGILWQVWRKQSRCDFVYLTVAESYAGNLRDLVIYAICRKRLDSVIVHMFGGAGMRGILEKRRGWRFYWNKYFLSRIGAIVVEGSTQASHFSIVAPTSRIHIVPNFAEGYLLASKNEIAKKFSSCEPLRLLFLSNMLVGKGYAELLEAYCRLDDSLKAMLILEFAGKPVACGEEFLRKVRSQPNVRFLGPVYQDEKKEVYGRAHVFCLPTYYPYEGQPFSILEAYASGCCVVTTKHSGIPDIFTAEENGFEVQKQNVDALVEILKSLLAKKDAIRTIAFHNADLARVRYTSEVFLTSMNSVVSSVVKRAHEDDYTTS